MWNKTKYDLVRIHQNSINVSEAGHFREYVDEIIEQGGTHLIIDLSELQAIGSISIGVLFSITKKIRERDGDFQIIGASPVVMEMLKLSKIDQIIEVHQKGESSP
ncbi:MAG: STAS domain-containing protein [SAR324 cluster bacterium]|nr:STAS domain-containing protein [SAR324 cluster bacterium]